METPTRALIDRHTALRRQALLAGAAGAGYTAGYTSGYASARSSSPSGSPRVIMGPSGMLSSAQQQPPGSRLATVSNVSSIAASSTVPSQYVGGQRVTTGDLPVTGARTPPPGGEHHRRTSSAGSGISSTSPLPGTFGGVMMGPLAASDLANNDQVGWTGLCFACLQGEVMLLVRGVIGML